MKDKDYQKITDEFINAAKQIREAAVKLGDVGLMLKDLSVVKSDLTRQEELIKEVEFSLEALGFTNVNIDYNNTRNLGKNTLSIKVTASKYQ